MVVGDLRSVVVLVAKRILLTPQDWDGGGYFFFSVVRRTQLWKFCCWYYNGRAKFIKKNVIISYLLVVYHFFFYALSSLQYCCWGLFPSATTTKSPKHKNPSLCTRHPSGFCETANSLIFWYCKCGRNYLGRSFPKKRVCCPLVAAAGWTSLTHPTKNYVNIALLRTVSRFLFVGPLLSLLGSKS